jgi:hypothetical protein
MTNPHRSSLAWRGFLTAVALGASAACGVGAEPEPADRVPPDDTQSVEQRSVTCSVSTMCQRLACTRRDSFLAIGCGAYVSYWGSYSYLNLHLQTYKVFDPGHYFTFSCVC